MDSDGADSSAGELELPMSADNMNGVTPHFPNAVVGAHLQNYDFMVNQAHFKGHQMGGFGGVLKNQSIGMSARRGKALIHSAGRNTVSERRMQYAIRKFSDERSGRAGYLDEPSDKSSGRILMGD